MKVIFCHIISGILLVIAVSSHANQANFPLIIMGGRWIDDKASQYSQLDQICHSGFTHVSSYFTESKIDTAVTLEQMVERTTEFADNVKKICPALSITVGLPRNWIFNGQEQMIQSFIRHIEQLRLGMGYWYSDEMILQMMRKGLTLERAANRIVRIANIVSNHSIYPYIVIEAGNYDHITRQTLKKLRKLDAITIKSFDEYPISKTGKLNARGLDSLINSLELLKSYGNIVFPVCGIHVAKSTPPSNNDITTMLFAMLMNGADGFFFYEERRATPDTIEHLGCVNPLLLKIHSLGVKNFKFKSSGSAWYWEGSFNLRKLTIVINNGSHDLNVLIRQSQNRLVIWPDNMQVHSKGVKLKPLTTLIFETYL